MKQGDFSTLAKDYVHRPGYSEQVLDILASYLGAGRPRFAVADIGAGTGKLTGMLARRGLRGYAVEPVDAMRQEGIRALGHLEAFEWLAGSAESTTLPAESVDWILMASAFHWTDQIKALVEFDRILRPGGAFTALWNPRNIDRSPLEQRVERLIREIVPDLKRVSSGSEACTAALNDTLVATGHFHEPFFLEAQHDVVMEHQRYVGAWKSVNDIQSQAGPARFQMIIDGIEELLGTREQVVVPYRTRAWTVMKRRAGARG